MSRAFALSFGDSVSGTALTSGVMSYVECLAKFREPPLKVVGPKKDSSDSERAWPGIEPGTSSKFNPKKESYY